MSDTAHGTGGAVVPSAWPITRRLRMIALALLLAGGLAACGDHARRTSRTRSPGPSPRLVGMHRCHEAAGFMCASLPVPLDHGGAARGILRLAVGTQQVHRPLHGVLLFLTGGPGQPGVSLIPRVVSRLGSALQGYRLVMFDQRGTGTAALRCTALQAAAGSSDLTVVPPADVASCARKIGLKRRYFTTPETVADIEALRTALGVSRLTLDGVSYGTYVAERYALTYLRRVAKLVLDSVVPQQGVDPLYLAALQATARVLRSACAQQRCRWDPAHDLQVVVDRYHNGPQLLNAVVAESVVVPSFSEVLVPLHEAADGRPQTLNRFLAAIPDYESAPADQLSQGLHESTLCLDLAAPWNTQASTTRRASDLKRALNRVPARSLYPFNRATAYGNGLAQGCLQWPPTAPPGVRDGDPLGQLPPVPVLLLAGGRDLSTPLAWAREEATEAPDGRLVVVPGAGHSVQTRAHSLTMRRILAHFLAQR
ncbi:MAG: alpha/beta fold hydrolase [Solirubrobacteraceae bacterium]